MDGLIDGEQNDDDNKIDAHLTESGAPSDERPQMIFAYMDTLEEPNSEDMGAEELLCLEAYLIFPGDTGGRTCKHKPSTLEYFSQ